MFQLQCMLLLAGFHEPISHSPFLRAVDTEYGECLLLLGYGGSE